MIVRDIVIFGSDKAHTYVEMSSIDKKATILGKKNPKSQYKAISPHRALQICNGKPPKAYLNDDKKKKNEKNEEEKKASGEFYTLDS